MNEELQQLAVDYWEYQLETSPTSALLLGDHRYDDRWEDGSREAEDRHIARLRDFAARAEAIEPSDLTPDERVSREVLVFEARSFAESEEGRMAEMAVNHTIGLQAMLPVLVQQFPIDEPEHATAMVPKYKELARAYDERTERLREGVANGRTPMASTAVKTVEQFDAHLGTPSTEDPLLALRSPADWDGEASWRDQLHEVVRDHVRPALQRHRNVIANEVIPKARPDDEPGLSWLPDGEEVYARAVHRYTTLAIDPREVHEIGRSQIARLEDEYRDLGPDALGTSNLEEIFARMREDPELHHTSGPPIVEASEEAMDRAKAAMGGWFGRLPRADCGVGEVASGPTAFYYPPALDGSRSGMFYINTANPSRWGTHEIEATAFHEGIPGHHLQIAIAQELDGVPEFRKHASVTAFVEGWALYAERLADEMQLYGSDLDRIGMLAMDSMRACRLVVDTGIHGLGWSRDQAISYFQRHSPLTLGTIEEEVDRYIGHPGQALAYMVGRLEILRIRRDAEERLGADFDIRGFHDTVLGSGIVPLETLESLVTDWAG